MDNYDQNNNGRIWVLWKFEELDIKLVECTDQYIHCKVYEIDGKMTQWLTAIYAHNKSSQRKILLIDLNNYNQNIQGHWMLIWDFNNVLKIYGRIGGHPAQGEEFKDIENMIKVVGLYEHYTLGRNFTWSYKHTNGIM